jgi:hypothetical protein
MTGRTYQQIVAERGVMGFAPPWRDPPESPPCPCEDGEPCEGHGTTDESLARERWQDSIAP